MFVVNCLQTDAARSTSADIVEAASIASKSGAFVAMMFNDWIIVGVKALYVFMIFCASC